MIEHQGALDIGRQIFAVADEKVRQATGESIVANAFDLARPALEKVVPGAAVLLPIIKKVLLPMVENSLAPDEYDAVISSVALFEEGLNEIVAAATSERQRIISMTDAEIDEYARQNGLYRETGTP